MKGAFEPPPAPQVKSHWLRGLKVVWPHMSTWAGFLAMRSFMLAQPPYVFWLWESYSFPFLTLPVLKGAILPFPPTGTVNTKMLYAKDPLCPLHPYWPSLVSESFFSHLPTVSAHYCTTELLSVPAKLLCCCYWGILNLYVFTWHVWVTSSHFYFNDVVTIGLNWIIH